MEIESVSRKLTFKQLEAVYWIVKLKGFLPAANKLQATPSAISKRVRDLEVILGIQLFDRTTHAIRLTERGSAVWDIARSLLEQRDHALRRLSETSFLPQSIRIGVSELTAMTWLPEFVGKLQKQYPSMSIQPHVDYSGRLVQMLDRGELDLVVVPDILLEPGFERKPMGQIELILVARPDLLPANGPMAIEQISELTILMQATEISPTARIFMRWLSTKQVELGKTINCPSLAAILGMALSGLGVAFLPRGAVQPLIASKMLAEIKLTATIPPILVVAGFAPCAPGTFMHTIASIARNSSTFNLSSSAE